MLVLYVFVLNALYYVADAELELTDEASKYDEDICYMLGTYDNQEGISMYDPNIDQCGCLPHVAGKRCDRCQSGYYNILSCEGRGCSECKCDPKGTKPNTTCDYYGQCDCKEGYSGYRCHKLIRGECKCTGLVEEAVNKLKKRISYYQQIANSPGNCNQYKMFENDLSVLKQQIEELAENIQRETNVIVPNNLTIILNETENEIRGLLRRASPKINFWSNSSIVADKIALLLINCKQKVMDICKKSDIATHHKNEIERINEQSKQTVTQLESLPALFNKIREAHKETTDESERFKNAISKQSNPTKKYKSFLHKFINIKNQVKLLPNATRNTMERALNISKEANEIEIPERTHVPQENAKCDVDVPEFKSNYENELNNIFKELLKQQRILDKTHVEIRERKVIVDSITSENKADVQKMKNIYENYISRTETLLPKLNANIEDILNAQNVNKNDLRILQKELAHLIHELEEFLRQLIELERFAEMNKQELEKLQKKVNTKRNDINAIKELISVLDAIPTTTEDLDEIEKEIDLLTKYFELVEMANDLEDKVENIGDINEQLYLLRPINETCPSNVTSEGISGQ